MTDEISRRMKSTVARLAAIVAIGFVFRIALMSMVHNPGLHDPAHYFILGRRLSQGHGFTIDYVWHYSRVPDDIVHATDHWMPLAGAALWQVSILIIVAPWLLHNVLTPGMFGSPNAAGNLYRRACLEQLRIGTRRDAES